MFSEFRELAVFGFPARIKFREFVIKWLNDFLGKIEGFLLNYLLRSWKFIFHENKLSRLIDTNISPEQTFANFAKNIEIAKVNSFIVSSYIEQKHTTADFLWCDNSEVVHKLLEEDNEWIYKCFRD